ncbi:MAG: aldo/keto reductase [Chloroflexi bacterium]|nr:aldo/keto reductase [Chloroflexota bacterium]
MEYRQLGGSGLRVSAIGLGGNTFGKYTDEAQSIATIRRALDLGVNHVDTADIYAGSVSEVHVGKAIAGRRHEVVLATKVGYPTGNGHNDRGMSYRRVIASCEGSLHRLCTDYVDLYYLHLPDPTTPLAETLRAFDDLVRQGKVRYVGISNHPAWQVCEALWIADRRGYQAPVVTQNAYNLLNRTVEAELVPFCRAHRIGIVPYYPLASGLLTGKYRPDHPIPPGVRGYNNPTFHQQLSERNYTLVDRLSAFAQACGHTVGELAIAWLLARPEVSSAITGVTKPEQVEANVAASAWRLSGEELQAIDKILAA